MKRSSAGCLLALALIAAPGESRATNFLSATVAACYIGTCEFLPQELTPGVQTDILRTYGGTGSPVLFQAEAALTLFDYDSFSAFARGSGQASLPGGTPGAGGYEAHGLARVIIRDAITVAGPGGSGTFRMVWNLTGSTDQSYSTSDPLQTNPLSEVQVGYQCLAISGFTGTDCGSGLFRYHQNTVVDETLIFDVPITFNVAKDYQLTFSLVGSAGTGNTFTFPLAFMGRAVGDFSSSGTLIDVAVFDGLGNSVDESGIQAQSLFRYDLVGTVPVPEPTALGLVALAALAETVADRRRNRA